MIDYLNRYGAYIVVDSIRRYGPAFGFGVGICVFLRDNVNWSPFIALFTAFGHDIGELFRMVGQNPAEVASFAIKLVGVLIGIAIPLAMFKSLKDMMFSSY